MPSMLEKVEFFGLTIPRFPNGTAREPAATSSRPTARAAPRARRAAAASPSSFGLYTDPNAFSLPDFPDNANDAACDEAAANEAAADEQERLLEEELAELRG